jgi:hypothetical protein
MAALSTDLVALVTVLRQAKVEQARRTGLSAVCGSA